MIGEFGESQGRTRKGKQEREPPQKVEAKGGEGAPGDRLGDQPGGKWCSEGLLLLGGPLPEVSECTK